MLREARKAGMPFDEEKLEASGFWIEDFNRQIEAPMLRLEGRKLPRSNSKLGPMMPQIHSEEDMHYLETGTRIHDALLFGKGLKWMSCAAWRIMEYLPFRRMDLQKDGTWKPISWPLPMGETRDMPDNALVHHSVIRRMQADKTYRPGM
jgi:hypothetical protein